MVRLAISDFGRTILLILSPSRSFTTGRRASAAENGNVEVGACAGRWNEDNDEGICSGRSACEDEAFAAEEDDIGGRVSADWVGVSLGDGLLFSIPPTDDEDIEAPVARLCDSKIESAGECAASLFVVAGIDISSEAIGVIKIAICILNCKLGI